MRWVRGRGGSPFSTVGALGGRLPQVWHPQGPSVQLPWRVRLRCKHGLSMGAGRRTRRSLASVWSPTIPAMIALVADAPALHMPEKVVSRTLNSRAGARAGGKVTWTHGGEERTAYGHRTGAVDQPSYKHGCKSEGLLHFMRLGWESHDCHGVHGMSVCRRTSSASGVAARPSGVRTTKA